MRAFRLHAYDGPTALTLEQLPDPATDDSSVLVEVSAIGVNFPDLLMTEGRYQLRPEPPFVPGSEIVGVVRSAPANPGLAPRDRVSAFLWHGGFAELAAVPPGHLVRIPDAMGLPTAAALMVNHHTAHFALVRRGRVLAGDTVLVLGAAGGVGSAGVQVAKALGATVVAGVSRQERAEVAQAAGADEVVVLAEGFAKRVRALTNVRGVDVVLDPVGDWLFRESTRVLAPEGRILIVGFAAGDIPTIRANRLLLNNISAVGVAWGAALDEEGVLLREGAHAVNRMFAEGSVHAQIGRRFRFPELPDALVALADGQIAGKGIVELIPDA